MRRIGEGVAMGEVVTNPDDWMGAALADAALAGRVKAAMKRKGKRRAWTKCPRCGGRIIAHLAGPRDHIRMACVSVGCVRVME